MIKSTHTLNTSVRTSFLDDMSTFHTLAAALFSSDWAFSWLDDGRPGVFSVGDSVKVILLPQLNYGGEIL